MCSISLKRQQKCSTIILFFYKENSTNLKFFSIVSNACLTLNYKSVEVLHGSGLCYEWHEVVNEVQLLQFWKGLLQLQQTHAKSPSSAYLRTYQDAWNSVSQMKTSLFYLGGKPKSELFRFGKECVIIPTLFQHQFFHPGKIRHMWFFPVH